MGFRGSDVTSARWAGRRRSQGQGFVEYCLIVLIVSLSAYVTLSALGYDVSDWYYDYSGDVVVVSQGEAGLVHGESKGSVGVGEPTSP